MKTDWPIRRSFLRDVLGDPEEGSRLVYADWLEEQGDPLGELIRVQAAMGRFQPRAFREELGRRERELLDGFGFGNRGKTTAEIASFDFEAPPNDWNYAIVDGLPLLFLSSRLPLALPPAEWFARFGHFALRIGYYDDYKGRYDLPGDALSAILDSPFLEHCVGLDLHQTRLPVGWVALLGRCPVVSRLLRLNLNDAVGTLTEIRTLLALVRPVDLVDLDLGKVWFKEGESGLAESMPLPSLRRLGLAGVRLSASMIEELTNAPPFSGLRSLNLSRCRLDDRAAQLLAEGTGLTSLLELDVSDNEDLTDVGALALVHSPHLARVRKLRIHRTGIGAATVEALCRTDRFFQHGDLTLWGCPLTDEALAILATSPHAALLRVFSAGVSGCTDAGARALAASPQLKGLLRLELPLCQVGSDGAEALTDPSAFPALEELCLDENPLGDRGALALARWCWSHGETTLSLGEVALTSAGVRELALSGYFRGLTGLGLNENPLGDEGVASLAQCSDLGALRELWINEIGLSDTGARALAESPYLSPELHVFAFGNSALGEPGLAVLLERFAGVTPSRIH